MSNETISKCDVDFSVDDIDFQRIEVAERGIIPANLAKLSVMVIAYHRANGDLAWLQDMAHEAEMNNTDLSDDYKIDTYLL